MNYREILEDFVNNENTEYCYDWQGFNYETILPCIEKLLKNENNLQSKIDKINQYIKEAEESNSYSVLPSGKISDVGYCLDALEDIEDILKEKVE